MQISGFTQANKYESQKEELKELIFKKGPLGFLCAATVCNNCKY